MLLKVACKDDGEPEIFRSIQGEGPMAGRARTFIRLSGCNLHCVWCDTAYTWNWVGSAFAHERAQKFDPAREMTQLTIAAAAARVLASFGGGLVITGGEPLLQTRAIVALVDAIRAQAPMARVEIETNGTIAPTATLAERADLFVVSPKLRHSGNAAALALKPESAAAFAALDGAVFKFVARTREDVAEAAAFAHAHHIATERIYIMPEGTTADALDRCSQAIIAEVLANGFAFSDRLHIRLFGAARGA